MPSGAASRQTNRMSRAPRVFRKRRRGDRRIPRRQHRIHQDHHAVGQILRRLEVILHRLQRFMIAIKPDMRHPRRRNQRQHAIEKSDAGAQDRRQRQFLALDHRRFHRRQRGFDLDQLQRQVTRDLVAEQHADLVQQLAKALGRTVALAHQRQFVLNQGMTDDVDAAGCHADVLQERGRVSQRVSRRRPAHLSLSLWRFASAWQCEARDPARLRRACFACRAPWYPPALFACRLRAAIERAPAARGNIAASVRDRRTGCDR